jgi:2-haloacid dehalogenase
MTRPAVYLFDAYGTLFDVHSVTTELEALYPGKSAALSQSWRAKQLEMTWQRTLMNRYADFATVTAEALRYACALHHCEYSQDANVRLLGAYERLALFADVYSALTGLRARGAHLGILSNGSPAMLSAVVHHNGVEDLFDAVLSVDSLGQYKPAPAVYAMAMNVFRVEKSAIRFVSANGWDAAGAKAFGFAVDWLNRGGLPGETTGLPPDREITRLSDLL